MQIEFEAAKETDEKLLMQMRGEFQAIEPFPNPLDAAAQHEVLLKLIENEQWGRIWLITADGETAGYIVLAFGYSLEYAGRDALIDELYVRENFQGKGIGKRALAHVEEFCRAENIKAVHLEVEHTNLAARTLYHKTGFEIGRAHV